VPPATETNRRQSIVGRQPVKRRGVMGPSLSRPPPQRRIAPPAAKAPPPHARRSDDQASPARVVARAGTMGALQRGRRRQRHIDKGCIGVEDGQAERAARIVYCVDRELGELNGAPQQGVYPRILHGQSFEHCAHV
jgi:hypothetical protein